MTFFRTMNTSVRALTKPTMSARRRYRSPRTQSSRTQRKWLLSYITNALDRNERMSFIQKQVGHTTTRMIVDHYFTGMCPHRTMEIGWKKRGILPPFYHPRRMRIFKHMKINDKNGGGDGSRMHVRLKALLSPGTHNHLELQPKLPIQTFFSVK